MEDERADDDVEDVEGVRQEKHQGTIGIEVLLGLRQDGQVFPKDHEESGGDQRDGNNEAPFDHEQSNINIPCTIRHTPLQTQYHCKDQPAQIASNGLGLGGCVQQAYSTSTMQLATMSTMMRLLMFSCTRSSSSMPNRCTAFATQKNRPLITTDGMPDSYISRKASEVKEQKPICTSTIITITRVKLDSSAMCLEAIRRTAAARPMMFMMLMMLMLEAPSLFFIRVPKLLETATVTLPTRPSNAIYFYVQPCPSNMTPNMPQQVQLVPTMLPQQIRVMNVSL